MLAFTFGSEVHVAALLENEDSALRRIDCKRLATVVEVDEVLAICVSHSSDLSSAGLLAVFE